MQHCTWREPATYGHDRHFSSTYEKDRLPGAAGSTPIVNESTFHSQEIRLEKDGQATGPVTAGNNEFPFQFSLPGDVSETVEGLPGNFIIYELKAVVERGIMAKDIEARRRLRIIRTLGSDLLELADPKVTNYPWNTVTYPLFLPRYFDQGRTGRK